MTVSQEQINDLYAAEVVTRDDENLGGVGQVYLDDQTGDPSWVSVKTGWFGTNESLVPLQGAEFVDGRIRVPHDKQTIKDAPNVDADAHLSEEQQDELFRYYGNAGVDMSRYDERRAGDHTGYADRSEGHVAGAVGDRDRVDHDHDRDRAAGAVGDRDLADHDRDRGMGDRDRAEGGSMTLHEERADVGTERVETGRARLRKHVVTEQKTVTVPVEREEVELVREPVAEGEAHDGARLGEGEEEVVLHEERPVVEKDVVATERVGLQKQTHTDEQQVTTDVSHEEVDLDQDGQRAGRDGLAGDGMDVDRDRRDLDGDGRRDV